MFSKTPKQNGMKSIFTTRMFKNLSFTLLAILSVLVSSAQTTFNYTGGIQTYTVPAGVTSINIDAYGAQGGSSAPAIGGLGARMSGNVAVNPGDQLLILVGQAGSPAFAGTGGGGGSFVVKVDPFSSNFLNFAPYIGTPVSPLVIAGGGGAGNQCGPPDVGQAGVTTLQGTTETGVPNAAIPGNGGALNNGGAGGGGFLSNGAGFGPLSPGISLLNGGTGAFEECVGVTSNGFGGGGGTDCACNGGGGGGYTGGDGGVVGGGGGSFNIGTAQINLAGVRSGNGQVIITELVSCVPTFLNPIGVLPDLTGECSVAAPVAPTTTNDCGDIVTGTTVTSFPITTQGTTVVTWNFDDGQGNTATQTQNVIVDDVTPPVPASSLLPPAPVNALLNVVEAANYQLVYELTIDNTTSYLNGANYAVNNSGVVGSNHNRVAYYMELDGQWVWVSMDDFAAGNLGALAIPNVTTNNVVWDQTVSNMNVSSNVGSIVTGTGITTGNIEMWRFDYATAGNNGIGGNNSVYDFDDTNNGGGTFGSFQVHNYGAAQTLFALNQFNQTGNKDLGIGNSPIGERDWTFRSNSNTYGTKKLYILVNNTSSALPDVTDVCSVTPPTPTATDNCAGVVNGVPDVSFPITAQGTTVVTWTYDDGNGNTSTQTQNVILSDVTAPVITCPANISVNNDPALCSAVVTYTAPIGTDNCAGASTAQTVGLASGSAFPLGVTTNTFVVTAANGQTANCSFTVTVLSPEIDVQGNAISIVDGDVTPVLTDATRMADALVCGGTSSSTFTIFNTGTTTLTLSNPTFAGGAAADFTLTTPPALSIAPGGTTTFTVTCDPSLIGNQNTTVTIVNNDCDENPYNFLIRCVGLADATPPTLTADADITTTTSADGTGNCTVSVAIPDAVFSDNCPITLNWDMTGAETASGTGQIGTYTFPIGTTTITYSVIDFGLNTATDVLVVTVTDDEAPVVTAAANVVTTTSADGTGDCTVDVAIPNATLVENCSATLTWAMTGAETATGSGQIGTYTFPVGTTTITYTYVDAALMSSTDVMTVTVTDNEAPVITTCPLDITINNDAGICGAVATFAAIANDNCNVVITYSHASGSTFPVGNTIITVTATDPAGLTDACSFFVQVNDNEAPNAICQSVTVNLDATGNGSTTAAAVNNGSSDNCGIASLSLSQTAFTCANVGSNTVTLTVTDNALIPNVTTCTATVTVVDAVAPVANCNPTLTVNLDASGNGSITPAMVNITSTDACGIASLSLDQTAFTCANVGSNTVTLTVTDVNSNSSTCTATVDVFDLVPPTAICQNINANLDASGNVIVLANAIDFGSNDACGIALLQINGAASQAYTCANIGANTATLTVIDDNSNTSTCTATITVQDLIPPTALCNTPLTIALNPAGNVSVTVADINNGSFDNCGLAGLSVAPNNFTCANIGANSVVLTVLDNNGLSSTCTSTINIIDNSNPVALCVNPATPVIVQLDVTGNATITPAMVNLGSYDNCGIATYSVTPNTFTCLNTGLNPVTLTVTDATGNSASCPSQINVQDIVAPVAVCQPVTLTLDITGNASLSSPVDLDGGSTDNCFLSPGLFTASQSAFDCSDLGTNNVTLTVFDVYGNSATCTSVVTVQDLTAPVATCQPFTVALDASGNASITAANVNNGSSDNCSITSMTVSPNTFTCANVGANNVTLTVTDAAGNASTCVAVVTVEDNSIPVVVCPTNITQNAILNNCGKIVTYAVGVTDNCSTVTQTDGTGLTSGSLFPVGVTTQTYDITDAGGNTVTCSFTVTIVDIQDPTITSCPANITVSNDPNNCNANVFWTAPTASDNCSGVVLTTTILPGSNFPVGTTPVTYTATDASGRTTTCLFSVTVQDTQLPTITCPAAIAVNTDPGVCFATLAALGSPITADNCGVLSVSNNAPVTFPVGPTTVTWTVTDIHSNVQTCAQIVTVTDNVNPIALCQNVSVILDVTGNGSTTPALVDNGSSDACGLASLTLSQSAFDCSEVGINPVTLTVVDVNGNSSTCTADVLVIDNIAPVAICQNISIDLDATGNASIIAADINNGSSDACGVTLAASQTAFTCANVGANSIVLTVTDPNSNVSTCTSTVTVVDVTAPLAVCQDMTVQLDASGNASVTGAMINNGSTDACGIASLTVLPNTFTCANVGANAVVLTVTDVNGNNSTCNATVTIQDNVAPVALCQNVDVYLDVTGNGSTTPALVDNGSSDACGLASLTLSQTAFDCSEVGINPVTLTVVDVNGNSSTCTADVTVIDNIAPVAVCQNISINLDATGNATIIAADINNGSSDACGVTLAASLTSFTCANVGANSVVLTVTDPSGNFTTCTSTVTVVDVTAPLAVCQDVTVQLDATGNATVTGAMINNGSSDACGIASLTVLPNTFTCANVGANAVVLTVTDVNGNNSTCNATVTIQDNVAPVALCQNVDVYLDVTGNGSTTAALVDNGSSDACGIASLTLSQIAFDCSEVGINPVTLTVVDVNGNSSTCTADVLVIDNIAPVAVCQDITVQLDASGVATITTAHINNGSSDACGVTLAASLTNFDCSMVGIVPVTLTVTDPSGNNSTCISNVTVQDNIAPIIACQDITVQLDAAGDASIVPADVTASATDNCAIATSTIDIAAFTCANVGPNTVTLTVTDVNGNVSTCTANVTVEDNVAPVALCQNVTVVLDVLGDGSTTAAAVDFGSSDACGIASLALSQTAFDCSNVGANPVTLTVVDVNGNSSTCAAVVTVIDNIAPNAVCQNISVSLDGTGNVTIVATDIDGGSTDACGIATYVASQTAFDCSNVGPNNVTLTLTDVNGNVSSCVAIVTVVDPLAPVITCPADFTVSNDPGLCTASNVAFGMATATDNCTSVVITNNAPAVFPFGPTAITWTATDVYGNTATCTQIVTVEDVENPLITCPTDITVNADAGLCTASAIALGLESTSDNCTVATVVNDAPATFTLGTTMVTWTVTDVEGNSATCNQFVTVVDTEAPAIACPTNVTVPALFGSCNALGVVLGTPITSDNCTVATVTNNAPVSYPLGSTTVTWTVTDLAGNSTSCTQTVTVIDTQLPTIACPANVTVPADLGLCSASGVVIGSPVTTDNCSVASVTNNAPSTFGLGNTTVTWTVIDGSTNSSTCTQTVTVLDTQMPTITCPAAVSVSTDLASCTATGVLLGTALTADNCSVLPATNNAPLAFPLGVTTVTWTVVDGSGNSATCAQTVTVNDTEFPAIVCPTNVTVPADLGLCTASGVALGTSTTSDNCTVASVSNNAPATFTLGATTVTWTVVDGTGNAITCNQTVTVIDTQLPTIACPTNVTVPADLGTCTTIGVALGTPTTADNCSVLPATNNGLAVYPLGNTMVTWTVVDGSGNSATCMQTITVIDTQMPTITCPVTVTVPADLGVCTASGVALGSPITNDNCSVASVTNNALATYPLGNTTVIWTVVDGSGNVSTCSQTVTVVDTQSPIVTCPSAITVPADLGSCTATGVVLGTPSVVENCSVASVTNNAPAVYPLGVTTVIWTVIDGSGNTTFCTQFVTITDTQMPTIVCAANVTVPAGAGTCVATGVVLTIPTTTDNCSVASVTNNAPAVYPLGNTAVTWTVTDGSGNTATCTQVVTVIDTQLPTIACPANVVIASNAGTCVATGVVLGTPVTTDNCSVASVTNNAPSTFPLGTTNVTWTVVDGSGNIQTCVQTVTVEDTQAPTIVCPSDVTVSAAGGTCSATTVALGTPTTADNCSVASVTNNAPAIFPLGATVVTWTVVDGSGNLSTCTQTVTVVDNQNPIIACPFPVAVTTDLGSCDATGVVLGTPTTADNCSIASVTNNAPVAFGIGTTTVVWTVTDGSGNTATCTQTVTVTDIELPTITCPANVTVAAATGSCSATGVVLGSPITADNCTVASVSNDAPSVYGLGTTTVTWTVVDGSGNVSTCTQTVTVTDTELPTIACPSNVTVAADLGSCLASGVVLGTPATTDNCSVASVTNNAPASYPLGSTTVTWTVVDGSGNTATCSQVITVIDTQMPTIVCAAPLTVNTDAGVCDATFTLTAPATADNCSVASVTSNAPATFPLGTTVVTWTVVDGSGNTAACTQTVTVEDNELPTIACQSDITLNNLPGFCGRSVNYATPIFGDNCTVASFTQTDASGYVSGDLFPIGTTYQEFTVVDNSGNTFTCGFNITIVDNELPVMSNCPADIVAFISEPGQCEQNVSWQNPTASDNCPGLDLTQNYFPGSSLPIGTTVVTYTATDNAGNSVSCSFSVTVIDQADPIVTVVNETKLTVNVNGASYQWVDCDNNYAPIAGATTQTFSPTSNGNYAVIVNTGGCPDTSNCETISVIGIEEITYSEIVLYPNPSYNGSFMISYGGTIEAIMVYDMTGREVGVDVDLNTKSVNGSELASGKYMVRILTDNQLITKELVVVKGE
jgi:hypothetical protein